MSPPPLPENKRDSEQLRLLSIFHYVYAALWCVGIFFLGVHYFVMHSVIKVAPHLEGNSGENQTQLEAVHLETILGAFTGFYLLIGVIFLIGMLVNFYAARALRQRKNRIFTIIVAALNCTQIPIGTALGVFTLVVLMRPSVMNTYQREE